jgi:hypothetical protein
MNPARQLRIGTEVRASGAVCRSRRGGVHRYETLENFVGLDYHNTDRIHPKWQRLAPGDLVRLVPRGWMTVAIECGAPPNALVTREEDT